MPERFEVRAQEADQRLDKLLRQRFPALSFGQTQKLIRGGRVRVDGRRSKAADRIERGAIVTLPFQGEPEAPPPQSASQIAAFKIYEDESLVALNKPAGLAVQGGSGVKTHVAAMIEQTDLRLVHRLDRETSGLLLLAQGALAAKHLTRAFANQEVQKSYLAVVATVPSDQGQLRLPLQKILVGGEGRMAIAPPDGGRDGARDGQGVRAQEAVTDFEVLDRRAAGVLIRLSPRTGRTHQLRVHSAHVFGGIYGDSKYGDSRDRAKLLMLHAWQARLSHPETSETLEIEAPPPDAFMAVLDRLEFKIPQQWKPI